VRIICLQVDESYPPNTGSAFYPFAPTLGEIAHQVLSKLGFEIVEESAACDAVLHLQVTAEALGGQYYGSGHCFSGAELDALIELSSARRPTHSISFSKQNPPPKVIQGCAESPWQAPFAGLWEEGFTAALAELWGPQIYVPLLAFNHTHPLMKTRTALSRALESAAVPGSVRGAELEHTRLALLTLLIEGDPVATEFLDYLPSEETLPYLYPLLAPGTDSIDRQKLVVALAGAGPRASGAIPDLIHILREEKAPWDLRTAASSALARITGEDMDTTNPQRWQEWWHNNKGN
jgi:hypothetical protein